MITHDTAERRNDRPFPAPRALRPDEVSGKACRAVQPCGERPGAKCSVSGAEGPKPATPPLGRPANGAASAPSESDSDVAVRVRLGSERAALLALGPP